MLNKVPEVTLAFWVIKIMSTTVGETGADYLAVHVGLGTAITDGIMLTLLVASLLMQLRARQYVPWRYWLTVVLVSVVGTQITDFLTDKLDISLYVSTIVFAIALAVTFAVWYAVERTLSIHTIFTRRRELFYWTAILFTFALGTAAGDLATEALQLGFRLGTVRRRGSSAGPMGSNPASSSGESYANLIPHPHLPAGASTGGCRYPTSRSRCPISSNEQRSLNQDLRGDPAQSLDPWCSAGRRSQRC
jgi:hypothetical protein